MTPFDADLGINVSIAQSLFGMTAVTVSSKKYPDILSFDYVPPLTPMWDKKVYDRMILGTLLELTAEVSKKVESEENHG